MIAPPIRVVETHSITPLIPTKAITNAMMFFPSELRDWTKSVFQKNMTNRVIKKIVFKTATRSGTTKDFTVKDCIFLPIIPGKKPAKSLGIMHIIKVPAGFIEKSIVPKGSSPKA